MANFEIHGPIDPGSGAFQRLAAPEFSGRIIDPLRQQFIDTAGRAVLSIEGLGAKLETLGWGIDNVAESVTSLQDQIVPRFDVQIHFLSEQLSLLKSIDSSLKNPRRVQAAERIEQASELLGFMQYDVALRYAKEAIDHDASNPGGYIAAGWALVGSNKIDNATYYFAKATHVTSDYSPWLESMRQLSRCQLIVGNTSWARENLNRAIRRSSSYIENQKQHVENLEIRANKSPLSYEYIRPSILEEAKRILRSLEMDLAGLEYEASIANAADGDDEEAKRLIEAAIQTDIRFAHLAIGEPLLEGHDEIRIHAISFASAIEQDRRKAEEKRLATELIQKQAERDRLIPDFIKSIEGLKIALEVVWPWDAQPDMPAEDFMTMNSEFETSIRAFISDYNKVQDTLKRYSTKDGLRDLEHNFSEDFAGAENAIGRMMKFWYKNDLPKPYRKASRDVKKYANRRKGSFVVHNALLRVDS
jgi:tetratricopeptide (TPR) repeat protein